MPETKTTNGARACRKPRRQLKLLNCHLTGEETHPRLKTHGRDMLNLKVAAQVKYNLAVIKTGKQLHIK